MDKTIFFHLTFRLTIWFLLTADLSLANIIIGITISILIPHSKSQLGLFKDWIKVVWEIILAIPQAYLEAIEIMISPHKYEKIVKQKIKPRRTFALIFLDIFLITFTPKTIVVNYDKKGWYDVHHIKRKKSLHKLKNNKKKH